MLLPSNVTVCCVAFVSPAASTSSIRRLRTACSRCCSWFFSLARAFAHRSRILFRLWALTAGEETFDEGEDKGGEATAPEEGTKDITAGAGDGCWDGDQGAAMLAEENNGGTTAGARGDAARTGGVRESD